MGTYDVTFYHIWLFGEGPQRYFYASGNALSQLVSSLVEIQILGCDWPLRLNSSN